MNSWVAIPKNARLLPSGYRPKGDRYRLALRAIHKSAKADAGGWGAYDYTRIYGIHSTSTGGSLGHAETISLELRPTERRILSRFTASREKKDQPYELAV